MIKGIGIDLVELRRIEQLLQRQPGFVQRILTDQECFLYNKLLPKRQIEFLAGRFAAKEALAKALGTGVGQGFSWHDASIVSNELGAPIVIWQHEEQSWRTHLSISHSKEYACAQVILEEKNESMSS